MVDRHPATNKLYKTDIRVTCVPLYVLSKVISLSSTEVHDSLNQDQLSMLKTLKA